MKTFEEINAIDISEHIEKKGNLSYVSWAWAWAEMKKIDGNAEVILHEFPDYLEVGDQVIQRHLPYLKDESGAWVKVSVTLNDRTETEWLPVMDFRNKSILNPNSMDINKAHKRCFVKALALHGLGLYIYAGEDLPTEPKVKDADEIEKISQLNADALELLIQKSSTPEETKDWITKKFNVKELVDLSPAQYVEIMRILNEKAKK